ncbi:MAG: molybdopterin-binding protein [Suipraeoptans sp.]
MKLIKTKDAVGHVLCHDITQIKRGIIKDAIFRKGHVVREEDIDLLLSIGKENLYVWESDESKLHEDEAAVILYDICKGNYMHGSEIKEGKIELIADTDGVLKIDVKKLNLINSLGEMMIASRHTNIPVKKGEKLAGTRVIPLVIEKEKMENAKKAAGESPIFQILPYKQKKVAIITTGSEVYKKLIPDAFTPVIADKLSEFPTEVIKHTVCNDDNEMITEAILEASEKDADIIILTGGMSVDPDDRTPLAIKNAGTDIVTYGAAVLPGAMFLMGYLKNKEDKEITVMGLPGCVMYAGRTIFDLVLPRVMADEKLKKEDFTILGRGGLCLSCETCIFPNCGFGKGV